MTEQAEQVLIGNVMSVGWFIGELIFIAVMIYFIERAMRWRKRKQVKQEIWFALCAGPMYELEARLERVLTKHYGPEPPIKFKGRKGENNISGVPRPE